MKRIQIKINNIYAFEVPDDFDYTDESAVHEAFAEYLSSNNMKASVELFSYVDVVCSECGISLQDEEVEDGACTQCEGMKNEL